MIYEDKPMFSRNYQTRKLTVLGKRFHEKVQWSGHLWALPINQLKQKLKSRQNIQTSRTSRISIIDKEIRVQVMYSFQSLNW